MEELVIRRDFWAGKRVLVTGHTGFKGSWLALWLAIAWPLADPILSERDRPYLPLP